MSAEENRKILEEAIAKWKAGDGMAIFNLLADDVVWTVIGSTAVSGTYRSRQAFIDGAVTAIGSTSSSMLLSSGSRSAWIVYLNRPAVFF